MPRVRSRRRRRTAVANAGTQRDFTLLGSDWEDSNAQDAISKDIVFEAGETTKFLQFTIRGDKKFDGTRVLVWTIEEDANFGFSQEIYIFNEAIAGDPDSNPGSDPNPDNRFINSAPQSIPLELNSSIKTAMILIEEDQLPDRIIKGTAGNDVLSVPNNDFVDAENRVPAFKYGYAVYGFAGHDRVRGADGVDDLLGWEGNDTLFGGNSSDYLAGHSGNDTLFGDDRDGVNVSDPGNDMLDGGAGNDRVFGGAGHDTLMGWEGNDVLRGGDAFESGADELYGEGGDDQLYGGGGKDTLEGGPGADRFEFYHPTLDKPDIITDFTTSEDQIGIYVGTAVRHATIYRNSGLVFWSDRSLAPDQFLSVNERIESRVQALDASDRFIYNQRSGRLYFDRDGTGTRFNRQLMTVLRSVPGVGKPDLTAKHIVKFDGREGRRLEGGPENDRLTGLSRDDLILGKEGNDRLNGAGGNDVLSGDRGADTVLGGAGNDLLYGGPDRDRLLGGTGADIFVLERRFGPDTILDFKKGEDRLGLPKNIPFKRLTFKRWSSGTIVTLGSDRLALLQRITPDQMTAEDVVFPVSPPPA